MLTGQEIESKHLITRKHAVSLVRKLRELGYDEVIFDGTDWFYEREDVALKNLFLRFRQDNHKKEMTIKARLSQSDTVTRSEYNFPLPKDFGKTHATDLINLLGNWNYVFSLKKSGIYFTTPNNNTISIYSVGADFYVEFECASKDQVAVYEYTYGFTPDTRINGSLPEMYDPRTQRDS